MKVIVGLLFILMVGCSNQQTHHDYTTVNIDHIYEDIARRVIEQEISDSIKDNATTQIEIDIIINP